MKAPKGFKFLGEPLRKYQWEAFVEGIERKWYGLFFKPGLGKTATAIQIARYKIQFDKVNRVLVVCPSNVMYNWLSEIEHWSEYKGLVLHGTHDERIELIKSIKKLDKDYKFFIINYEALHPFQEYLLQNSFQMVIFDESSRYIRNLSAKRTVMSIVLADRAKHKLILTGTPIANSPLDLWTQVRVLDGGDMLGWSFYHFRRKYFYPIKIGKRWNKWIIRDQYKDYFKDVVQKIGMVVDKTELDLPKQLKHEILIEPDEGFYRDYKKLRSEIEVELETSQGASTVEITHVLSLIIKLRQFTAGFIKDDNDEFVRLKDTPKLDMAVEKIDEIVNSGSSVVVWCVYRKSIEMIGDELDKKGIKYITLTGKDQGQKKYQKWRKFQKSKNIKVFIGQIQMGLGIELFKEKDIADAYQYTIFYELDWIPDSLEQSMDRIHRLGQTATCIYYFLIVKDTIDEKIYNTVISKKSVADEIVRRGWKWVL